MARFLILTTSSEEDPVRALVLAELKKLFGWHLQTVDVAAVDELAPARTDTHELAAASEGWVLLFDPSEEDGLRRIDSALAQLTADPLRKPIALVLLGAGADQGATPVKSALAGTRLEEAAFVFPDPVRVCADRSGGRLGLDEQTVGALRSLTDNFPVYCAAMRLYQKLASGGTKVKLDALDRLRVNHLNVLTTDLQRSLSFYETALGARHLYNLGPKKAVTAIDGFEFFIESVDDVAYPKGFHFGVRTSTEGVYVTEARLARAGIKFVKGNNFREGGAQKGIDGIRHALYFEDPDGLLIEVYSPETAMVEHSQELIAEHLGQ
jgi:catechol 2,3-dioxygenase-like lactoylglutathione lyase family enzyme